MSHIASVTAELELRLVELERAIAAVREQLP
jgi:hypothetical protein